MNPPTACHHTNLLLQIKANFGVKQLEFFLSDWLRALKVIMSTHTNMNEDKLRDGWWEKVMLPYTLVKEEGEEEEGRGEKKRGKGLGDGFTHATRHM